MASAPAQAPPVPGAAQASNADSDDSSVVTRIFTIQDRLDEIQELRQRKSILGGRLSRPLKEYRKEDVKMHPPRPGMLDDPDQAYYSMCLFLERKYWDGELRAWESLLTRIQRRWERRNAAAGDSIPPPPPVQDMDPLELNGVYLELVPEKVEAGAAQGARNPFSGGWHFGDYALLLEHFQAMEQLVEEMRKDHATANQALTEGEDHVATNESLAFSSSSGARKKKRPQGDDSEEDATPQSGLTSNKTRAQKPVTSTSTKRKRTGGDEREHGATQRAGPAPKKARTQNKSTAASTNPRRAQDDKLVDDTMQQAGPASKKTRKGQPRAPTPKKQNVRGNRTKNPTSKSAAEAADVPNGLPEATCKRVRNKEVQAKHALDNKLLNGRVRRGKEIGGQPTGSSRRSMRKAGLPPENSGL